MVVNWTRVNLAVPVGSVLDLRPAQSMDFFPTWAARQSCCLFHSERVENLAATANRCSSDI